MRAYFGDRVGARKVLSSLGKISAGLLELLMFISQRFSYLRDSGRDFDRVVKISKRLFQRKMGDQPPVELAECRAELLQKQWRGDLVLREIIKVANDPPEFLVRLLDLG